MLTSLSDWLTGLGSTGMMVGYIDPGTGNVLVPAAVGSLGAALLVVKHYWRKLTGRAASDEATPDDDEPSHDEEPSTT